jgi:hypothetical protein
MTAARGSLARYNRRYGIVQLPFVVFGKYVLDDVIELFHLRL